MFSKDNTPNVIIIVMMCLLSFMGGMVFVIGTITTSRDAMKEAYKLGYTQQLVDENDKVTYEWRDFHDVEKHYSGLEDN